MMIREKITKYFIDRGFYRVNLGKEFMELFYVPRDSAVSLVWVLDDPQGNGIDNTQFKGFSEKIRASFHEKGFETINLLGLFLSHDPFAMREIAKGEAFWVVDENYGRLVIYNDMPEDFEGLKLPIEEMLSVTGFGVKQQFTAEPEVKKKINIKSLRKYERRPYVMFAFLAINILVFLLTDTFGNLLHTGSWKDYGMDNWWLVFHEHEYYRLLTATFLHSDISHILGNMIGLYALGEVLEFEFGHLKFAIMYIVGGILASLGSCWYYMMQESIDMNDLWRALEPAGVKAKDLAVNATYSLGASGAIYAMVGMLAAYLFANRGKSGAVDPSRLTLFLFYIFYTFVQGFRGNENIDNAAHLAGFIAGIGLYILIITLPGLIRKRKS